MIIHCGSNDLTEVKTADLIHDISADIIRFKLLLPNTKIIWSDILMRRYWHGMAGPLSVLEIVSI